MLGTLITSKTRIKLLLKFFLNANNTGYLKNLEQEFEDSSNGIRVELNKFEEAGLLTSENIGNKKVFRANKTHPLFRDIHNIILKYAGIDQIIENIIKRIGDLDSVYVIGSFARGIESSQIEIVIVGKVNNMLTSPYVQIQIKLNGMAVPSILQTAFLFCQRPVVVCMQNVQNIY